MSATCIRCSATVRPRRPWSAPGPLCASCRRRTRTPERAVQAQCAALLRSLGGQVWTLGTTRRRGDYPGTMQTPGLPDVIASLKGRMLMLECKAEGGRLSDAQRVFAAACADCGVHHVVGGVEEVYRWLVAEGLVRPDRVPHGRLPAEGQP